MNPQTEIEILKLEKAVAELDVKWLGRQDSFKVQGRYKDYIPQINDTNVGYGLLILAFVSMMVLYWVSLINSVDALFCIVIMAFFTFSIYQSDQKAKFYEEQKAIYDNQRETLLLEIQKLKSLV